MVANRLFNVDRRLAHALPQSSCLSPKSANADSPKEAIEKLQISPIEAKVNAISNERSCISSRIVKPKTHRERTCCYVRTSQEIGSVIQQMQTIEVQICSLTFY